VQEEQRHLEAHIKRTRRKAEEKEGESDSNSDCNNGGNKSSVSSKRGDQIQDAIKSQLQLPLLKEDKFLIQSYVVGNLSDSARLIASLQDTQSVSEPTDGSMGLVISNKKLLELWDQVRQLCFCVKRKKEKNSTNQSKNFMRELIPHYHPQSRTTTHNHYPFSVV
jgi:hypothetical protein